MSSTSAHVDEPSSQVLAMFGHFRDELDEHHDRRERIIKASRDITALSKKIIFSLQRVRTLNAKLPAAIAKDTQSRFDQIRSLFESIMPDLQAAPNRWRYLRQISPGIQEYIEAVSFHQYVRTQTLITIAEVQAGLPAGILVTEEDYVMGLFDLTGEMMRFAVMSLSAGNAAGAGAGAGAAESVNAPGEALPTSASTNLQPEDSEMANSSTKQLPRLPTSQAGIVIDLRTIRSLFELLNVPRRHQNHMFRDMAKKTDVMQTSVEKVERAAYGILVRGSERPSGWTPDLLGPQISAEVESY